MAALSRVPAGTVLPYAGSSEPDGWMFCDGRVLRRDDYPEMYSAIGTIYGSGDGLTTFNIPDFRGRVLAGTDNLGGTSANRITDSQADTTGGSMGEETHVLTVDELASHSHAMVVKSSASGSEIHVDKDQSSTGTQTLSDTTGAVGTDVPHNNVQPTIFISWIIRAA